MQQSTPTRGTGTTWVAAIYEDKQRRRLVIAFVLLLAAITALLVKDYEASLANNNDDAAADSQQVAIAPPPSLPTVEAKPPVAAAPSADVAPRHSHSSVVHNKAHLAANAVKPGMELASVRSSAVRDASTTANTAVAARTDQARAHQQSPAYPLLTQATAVQGSVLLQALIAADGTVQDMRVISGPTILVSAARQAVQQWRFKPYLLNGKPVETYARVTVNFAIDVSNTEARYHVSSVTSAGAL